MDFPAGQWNVFGRSGHSLSDPKLVDGAAATETPSLSLGAAATLTPMLPADRSGVVYVPRRGVAFPATQRTAVPAGEELWLIVLEKSVPIAIVPIPALEPGSERSVDARGAGLTAILGWLQVPEADQDAIRNARGVTPPRVRMTSAGPSHDSDPLPPLESLNGAFVLLRGVSAGDAEVDVSGHGWLAHRRRVKVGASSITVAHEPLIVRTAASLIVHWRASDDVPDLDRSLGSCNPAAEKPPQFEITISACPAPQNPREPVDPKTCQVVRQESFPPELLFGSFPVDGVPPGSYRVELRFGKLPPVSTTVQAVRLQQRPVRLFADYFEIYGSLTYGGEPLGKDAAIAFPDGVGFASAETGQYRAAVIEPFDTDAQIQVGTCDGALRALVLAERPARRNARFNIDIPDNALVINVTDTFTRMPLGGATVRVVVMDKLRRRPVLTRVLKTEEPGRATMKIVPERELRISVSLAGYQKYQVGPFTMPKSGEKTVDVQLVPLRGNTGKIVSPRPFDSGTIFWFSPAGRETERADFAPDGTFIYAGSHEPDETMAVVSLSHPLWVHRSPAIGSRSAEPLAIRFPDAPARAFEVAIQEPRAPTHIGLVIGGVRVPQPALQLHQTLRDLRSTVHDRTPLPFRDIAETGPIDVILGPATGEVPSNVGGFDFLALPRFADAPRKRLLPGATSVVFE